MENRYLFLFLASGIVNDEGFWLIGVKNTSALSVGGTILRPWAIGGPLNLTPVELATSTNSVGADVPTTS